MTDGRLARAQTEFCSRAEPRVLFCSRAELRVSTALGRFALVLVASLFAAQAALAQAEPAAPAASTDIENEAPPGDPPPAPKGVLVEEKPEEGSIKDVSEKRRPYGISLDAHLPWLEGIGFGYKLSAEIPIMHNGFIPSINDSFSLEPRFLMAYQHWRSFAVKDDLWVLSFTPAVAAVWSFYFKTNLRAYAFVSFGFSIVQKVNYADLKSGNLNRFYHDAGVGGYWDFAAHWALRGEIGYAAFRFGLTYLI